MSTAPAPAFAPIATAQTFAATGEECTVTHTTIDMLSVGQSLRTLARDPRTPHGTREIFARVGAQMFSAAMLEIKMRSKVGAR